MSNTSRLPPVAVVTGAGRRLGLLMTKSLLAQGWRVLALTRQVNENVQAAPESLAAIESERLECIQCDLLSDTDLESVAQGILARHPRIDFVLHNASIYKQDQDHADTSKATMDFYDALFRIHMKAPARLNQILAPALANSVRPTGNIIHITDIYVNNPNPNYALYCSTKAGAENLMTSFAKKLAPKVRVNAIQPGPVKFLPEHSAADQEKVLSETLLPVEGGFEALEKAIYSILDNEYMTAAVIRVDGGRSVAR